MNLKNKMNQETFYKVLKNFLMVTFLLQFLFVVYINLFEVKYHLSYDACINYVQTILSWQKKELFLSNWQYTTNLQLDNILPITVLLMG